MLNRDICSHSYVCFFEDIVIKTHRQILRYGVKCRTVSLDDRKDIFYVWSEK